MQKIKLKKLTGAPLQKALLAHFGRVDFACCQWRVLEKPLNRAVLKMKVLDGIIRNPKGEKVMEYRCYDTNL